MRLILIRHGQTPSNEQGLLDTAIPGADLSDLGREQAAAVPVLLDGQRVDAVYASTLVRSQQTAEPLAADRGLRIEVRDGIREVAAGDLEMLGTSDAIRSYLGTIGAWMAGDLDARMPGGEAGRTELDRFDAVVQAEAAMVREAAGDEAGIVLVGHGAMLRLWAAAAAVNLPGTYGARNPLHNAGMILLDGDPDGGWRAVRWMDSAIEELDEEADGPAGVPLVVPANSRHRA
jgi:broad specificity phosphatase PhoE